MRQLLKHPHIKGRPMSTGGVNDPATYGRYGATEAPIMKRQRSLFMWQHRGNNELARSGSGMRILNNRQHSHRGRIK